jgi:hypothetical protein
MIIYSPGETAVYIRYLSPSNGGMTTMERIESIVSG